ncbi:MAG TPA: hypothetical protein VI318_08555, partial [Baekduia sp.]
MTRRRDRRPLRRLAVGFILVVAALPLLVLSRSGTGVGQESESPLTAQSQLGVPDNGGTIFGASGSEAPGEVWSIGDAKLLRGSDAGWSVVPAPTGTDGQPVSSFSPAAGRSTPDGAVVVLSDKGLVVRDPGGAFHVAPDPETAAAPATTSVPGSTSTPPTTTDPGSTGTPGSTATPPATDQPPLLTGEALYSGSHVLLAPAEQDGHAGAYVVPTAGDDKAEDAVLRFDGTKWTREDICMDAASPCAKPQDDTFKVVAIDTAGPGDAWLLATGTPSSDGIVLFRRQAADGGDPPTWRPVSRGTSPFADAAPTVGGTTVHLSPRAHGQALTATTQGAWVDATVKVGSSQDEQDATFFYDESGGSVAGTWCDVAVGTATLCDHPLGAPLPSGDGRSFAWADGSAFGRRVITGLPQGVILRLGGATFDEVPTLGGTLGTASGAAFAADDDGWLGGRAPARITRTAQTVGLRAWPVPFRHTLTAIAPEPGKAIAAIDSSALAVGDDGEVARYSPGAGWQPEYLTSASGARATPRLRGVAWPTPDRAYAVGDGAEMWLWRRATGLWEPDPAKPPNLALANFNGIAFDPGNPDRGYAIGKQGVLLRYDRQWTQEPLPDGLDQANFTSIA